MQPDGEFWPYFEVIVIWGDQDCARSDIITISGDGTGDTLRVWSSHPSYQWPLFTGHHGIISGISFSPDGKLLTTADSANTIRLWDVATGRQLLVLKGHAGSASTEGLAFVPSGDRIVSTALLQGANAIEVKTWDATPLPGARQP